MKGIRIYSIGIILLMCVVNSLILLFITPLLGKSEVLKYLLSAVISSGVLFILLEGLKGKIRQEIKIVEDSMRQFAKGNFLSGLGKRLSLNEFKTLEEQIVKVEEKMKNWVYHILYSEVNLGSLAKKLNDSSKISLKSMREISGSVDDMRVGSTKAANDSAENAAISEELLGSNTEVAAYSNDAKNFAQESVENIKRDSKVISDALSNVGEIGTLMTESSSSINTLKQLLESIASMAGAISAIADQTNLLSLNASIEAARAGDAGRGFGVVANEIKKLSEQSANTVTQINKNISSIEKNIHHTISIMDLGAQKAAAIKDVSGEASKNLLNINDKIKSMVDLISNINSNITEQSYATEALTKNIENIAGFTNDTDKTTRSIDEKIKEQVHHSESNTKISEDIVDITDKFSNFLKPIEKELDTELLEACNRIAKIISNTNLNNEMLDRISKNTGITELFITDGNGVITHSNNTAAIGFAFSNAPGSQTYDFYKILNNSSLKVCQRMRKRDIDDKYFKIVGISRTDTRGIIQVGLSLEDIVKFRG